MDISQWVLFESLSAVVWYIVCFVPDYTTKVMTDNNWDERQGKSYVSRLFSSVWNSFSLPSPLHPWTQNTPPFVHQTLFTPTVIYTLLFSFALLRLIIPPLILTSTFGFWQLSSNMISNATEMYSLRLMQQQVLARCSCFSARENVFSHLCVTALP